MRSLRSKCLLTSPILVIFFYNLLFFNRYLPITEGWFSTYSHLIREGLIPYRDFYFYLTPLYLYVIAAFQSVFGDTFIALRLLGVAIVVLIGVFSYLILNKYFPRRYVSISVLVSTIYYQSGVAHISYDFIQFFTLFSLLGIYFLIKSIETKQENDNQVSKHKIYHLILAGIFISSAFLIKQSNGTFLVLFSLISALFVTYDKNFSIWLTNTFFLFVSMLVPIVLFLIWFSSKNALSDFIQQVFFGAISTKGSLSSIFTGWLAFFNKYFLHYVIKVVIGFIFIIIIFKYFIPVKITKALSSIFNLKNKFIFFILLNLIIFLSYALVGVNLIEIITREHLSYFLIATSLATLLVLSVYTLYQLIFSTKTFNSRKLIVLLLLNWGLIFGNGTSAGLSEVGTFLSFGIMICCLFSIRSQITTLIGISLCFYVVMTLALLKFNQPYTWWGIASPSIKSAQFSVKHDLLTGLFVSDYEKRLMEDLVQVINNNSLPTDEMFTFPNIPSLYILSSRFPNSKVIVSWYDFLPDKEAESEAKRLMSSKPKIIVNLKMPENVMVTHELLFRNNKKMGQREIVKAMNYLIVYQGYTLLFSRKIRNDSEIEVWSRL